MTLLRLFLLLLTLQVGAATRYVTTGGNNSNDGTAADVGHAWLTIQNGLNNIAGGDTLNIGPGTYDEALIITDSRSGSSWGTATTIQGTNVVIAWNAGSRDVTRVQIEGHYIILSGITVDGASCATTVPNPCAYTVSMSTGHHIRWLNCKIDGPPRGMGILLHDSAVTGANEIISCVISNQGWGFVGTGSGDTFYHPVYIESPNNLVDGCTLGPPGLGARNHLDEAKNAGVQIFESNHGGALTNNIIRNCTINGPSRVGFTVCGDPGSGAPGGYNKYYNNTIHDTIYGAVIDYHCGTNSFFNNTFYNISYGIWNDGTDFGPHSGGNVIANNIFVNVTNNIGIHKQTVPSRWTNNVIYNCGPFLLPGEGYTIEGTVLTDPLLISPATGDFTISAYSPAKDAGKNLSSVFTTDKAGTTRTVPWDIGAYESGGGVASLWAVTASLDFGSVHKTGSATPQSIVLTNSGTAAGNWTATTVPTGFALSYSSGLIGAASSETLTCTATPPTDAVYAGNVVFDFSDPVAVTVTGTNYPAAVALSRPSISFGSVKTNTAVTVSTGVTNVGEVTLVGGTATASGAPFSITAGAALNLAPGANATTITQFAPTALGAANGTVTFVGGNTVVVPVEGNGIEEPPVPPTPAGPPSAGSSGKPALLRPL